MLFLFLDQKPSLVEGLRARHEQFLAEYGLCLGSHCRVTASVRQAERILLLPEIAICIC